MSVELCRLCGKDGVTNVYDETDLWRKIFVCFGVEINTNDNITKKICKSCYFFTNSVYEFRLSSIEHDNKLKKEYAETIPKVEPKETTPVPISYPSEISQDAFLNTLNLASKSDVCLIKPVFHPSVLKLKRKWPNINIPKECYQVDLQPFISLEVPAKLLKLSSPQLGIWSVKNKQHYGKQPDLVLTRIRSANNSTENLNTGSDKSDISKFKFNNSAASLSEQPSTSNPTSTINSTSSKKRKKYKRYPDWGSGGKKRGKGNRFFQRKRSTSEKIKNQTSPAKSESSRVSVSPRRNIAKERTTLKYLLETDAHLNQTLQKQPSSDRPSTSSSPDLKSEEYGNLLVAAGEEVQTFICVTCNQIFDTLALLNNHKKNSHKSSLRCTKCSKRFAIVESLVKHNLACHPEIEVKLNNSATQGNQETIVKANSSTTNDNQETIVKVNSSTTNYNQETSLTTNDNKETVVSASNSSNDNQTTSRSSVARKHTSGTIESKKSSVSAPTLAQPDILEYIISDDDDVEITDVIENATSSNTTTNIESPFETIIKEALKPQKPSNSESSNVNCSVLYDALIPQITSVYTEDKQKKTVESEIPGVIESKTTNSDDIFLVDDSDDEKEVQNQENSSRNEEEEQSFVILDDSNSSKETELVPSCSSSGGPSTSTDTKNTNVSQKIVVVPSAEDKAHMDSSSSVKAKITNEISYINYIFNKCNFNYLKSDNPKGAKSDKKWFLKDIHKFTEKTFLSVQLNRVVDEDASLEYTPIIAGKPQEKIPFWDSVNAIDINKKVSVLIPESPAALPTPPKHIFKESSFVSQSLEKKSTSNVKTGGKSILKQPKIMAVSLPKSMTSSTVVARTLNFQTSTIPPLKPITPSTVIAKTTNAVIPSESTVSSPGPTNKVPHTPTTMSTPVALVRTTNVQNTSNIVANTMFVVSQSSQVGGSIQVVTTSSNGTFPNSQTPRTCNAALPSVAVAPTGLQKIQSPQNIDIHTTQKLLNLALQNAALNNPQPKGQVRSYTKTQSFSPVLSNPKPLLPISPSPAKETIISAPELQEPCNGYILVGVSAANNETGGVVLDESNAGQKQPIVLNGMSYPSFAKIRNSNTPTFMLQQVGQQTNVNIQNCINITTNTVNEQFATVPYVIQDQPTAPIITPPAAPLPVQSMAPLLLQSVSSVVQAQTTETTETTSDATVSTTRPTIRIKNLSELRGDNLNTNQRNELHNLYSNTLTNYVQNYSNAVANSSPNEEYLQIS